MKIRGPRYGVWFSEQSRASNEATLIRLARWRCVIACLTGATGLLRYLSLRLAMPNGRSMRFPAGMMDGVVDDFVIYLNYPAALHVLDPG
jgi:hypothetical protein